jgi:hypothetical protein
MIDLDKKEIELINKFREHKFFHTIELLSDNDFLNMLFQRRFFSLAFTGVYDMTIDALNDFEAKKVVRKILREEYPDETGNTPSHREYLIRDLVILGAKKEDILKCRPTIITNQAIDKTFDLIRNNSTGELSDLKLLTIIRFWGEVLVSVEYGQFWKRMYKSFFTNTKNESKFFYPHYCHDEREPLVKANSEEPTHSGEIGSCLIKIITKSKNGIDEFINMEKEILSIKNEFYNQFIKSN